MIKRFFVFILIITGAVVCAHCGNPSSTYVSQLDSSSVTRPLQQGEAYCNVFSIPNLISGNAEHPTNNGIPDNAHLILRIGSLSGTFVSNQSNSIQFYRAYYTMNGSSPSLFEDPTPLPVNLVTSSPNSSQAITPASLQAAGISGVPFNVVVSNTDEPYTILVVAVNINGSSQNTGFLIPLFDADPMTYQQNHSQFPAEVKIHPFYSQMSQAQDYVSMAQAFCFN